MLQPVTRAALFALLGGMAQTAAADATSSDALVRTELGPSFVLPNGLSRAPGDASPQRGELRIEQSFVDAADPSIRVLIMRKAIDSLATLRALPTRTGPLPKAFASGVAAALGDKRGQEPQFSEYDAGRHAFTTVVASRLPSPARVLIAQSAQSPAWTELARSGADVSRVRCVFSSLLAADAGIDAFDGERQERAASRCRLSLGDVTDLVRAQPPGFFAASDRRTHTMSFISDGAMTMVVVQGPAEKRARIDELSGAIWSSAETENEVREPSRVSRLFDFSEVRVLPLLSVLAGALTFAALCMTLLSLLLARYRVAKAYALTVPCLALLAFALLELTMNAMPSGYLLIKVLAYALTARLSIGPLQRLLPRVSSTARMV